MKNNFLILRNQLKDYVKWAAFILITTTTFISCSDIETKDEKGNYILLRLNPKIGTKYNYAITTESYFEQGENGKTEKNVNGSEADYVYECTKDSEDQSQFLILYEKVKFKMGSGRAAKEIDATEAVNSHDLRTKYLNAFDHAIINALVLSNGQVKQISGEREINHKMHRLVNNDPAVTSEIETSWNTDNIKVFFKKTLQHVIKRLPDSAIKVGESWVEKSSIGLVGGEIPTQIRHVLKSVKGNSAYIESIAEVESKNEMMQIQGVDVIMNLTGSQKENIVLDIKSGLVSEAKSNIMIKGNLNVQGRIIEINFSNSSQVKQRNKHQK